MFVEQRAASAVVDTATVPNATLLNVPSASPTGPVPDAPVVAVNTVSKWKSKIIWLSAVVLPVLTWLYTWLTSAGIVAFKHHPAMFASGVTILGFLVGYLRTASNTVTK
jgi:uncharacterized membrane protein YozB (DUF420 family)